MNVQAVNWSGFSFVYGLVLRAAAMMGATETVLMGLGIVSVPTILVAPAVLIRFSAPSASTGWVQSTKIRLAPFFLQALAASAMVPPVLMMSSAKTMSRPFTSTLPVSISSLDFVDRKSVV